MKLLSFVFTMFFLASCNTGSISKDGLKKMLKENPDILTEAIKENPSKILDAFKEAAQKAQVDAAKRRQEEEKKELEERYEKPLVATIRKDELFRGKADGPITLVEYSDFQCYYCSKAFKETVLELLDKYGNKIRFVYKHLPVIGKYSRLAAQYYEALRLQDPKKAIAFHDQLFDNQQKIRSGGEKFLKAMAKKAKGNMKRLAKDLNSDAVNTRIDEDEAEARKFGFSGTPGFLLNGIPVKGAYPTSHFIAIVDELKKRGKLKL